MGHGGRSPPKKSRWAGGINKSQVIAINYDFLKLENGIFQQSQNELLDRPFLQLKNIMTERQNKRRLILTRRVYVYSFGCVNFCYSND